MSKTLSVQRLPLCFSRKSHTGVVWNGDLYFFGGEGVASGQSVMQYSFRTQLLVEFSREQNAPLLSHHSSVVYKDKMYVFGGESKIGLSNAVHVFNFKLKEWSKLNTKQRGPLPRKNQSIALFGDKLIVTGGENETTNFLDFWILDLENKTWNEYKPNLPPLNFISFLAVHENKMIVLGEDEEWSVIIEVDIRTMQAERSLRIRDIYPKSVNGIIYNNSLYLYDGLCSPNTPHINNLYELNLNDFVIIKHDLGSYISDPRCGFVCLNVNEKMYICGGENVQSSHIFNDIWEINLQTDDIFPYMGKMFNEETSSDFNWDIEGEEFHFHKCILTSISRKFSPTKEYLFILYYLYTGKILTSEITVEILQEIKKYKLYHLLLLILNHNIHHEDISFFLNIFLIFKDEIEVSDVCINLLYKNRSRINKSMEDLRQKFDEESIRVIKQYLKSKKEYTPMNRNEPFQHPLINHIKTLRRTTKYTDLSIKSKDGIIFKCHKVILMAFDDYFHYYLKNNSLKELSLEYSSQAIDFILNWIYQCSPHANLDIQILFEIYDYSKMVNNKKLMLFIENEIIKKILPVNVMMMYNLCKEWKVQGPILRECEKVLKEIDTKDLLLLIFDKQKELEKKIDFFEQKIMELSTEQREILHLLKSKDETTNDGTNGGTNDENGEIEISNEINTLENNKEEEINEEKKQSKNKKKRKKRKREGLEREEKFAPKKALRLACIQAMHNFNKQVALNR